MQNRNTIVMAIVLVAISAFVYFYEIRGRAEREEADKKASLLLDFEIDTVTGITVATAEGTVRATKVDGVWNIVEPIPTGGDGAEIDKLIDELARAAHQRVVVEAAEDLAPFGLEDPVASVTLHREGDESLLISVGGDTPVGMNAYATTGTERNIYSTTRALRTSMNKSLFDLRDRTVVSVAPSDVTGIDLEHGGATTSLRRDAGGPWQAERPFAGPADSETVQDLLDSLTGAEAEAFVSDDAGSSDLASFGLDAPRSRATLTTPTGSLTLLIGDAAAEPEGLYAMQDGGAAIFVVGADLVDEFPEDAATLRNKQVLDVDRQRIAELTISRTGEPTVELTRRDTEWLLTAPAADAADASAVSQLISGLQDMRAEGFADGSAGNASGSIRVGLREPGQDDQPAADFIDITFGAPRSITPLSAADDEAAEPIEATAVSVDGGPAFLVPSEELEPVLVDLFTLRAKTLVEFTQDELASITISGADRADVTLRSDGETWNLEGGDLGDTDVTDLLWELNYLRMQAVAAEWTDAAPDLSAYGLDAPRLRVVAQTADGVIADVQLGSEIAAADDSARVYALVGGRNGVFEVGASLPDAIEALLEALAG